MVSARGTWLAAASAPCLRYALLAMAARRKPPLKRAIATNREFVVVLEDIRGHQRAFGEALQSFREDVDRRFDGVEQDITLLKDAVLEQGRELKEHGRKLEEHGRNLEEQGRELKKHGQKLDTLQIAVEKKVDRDEVEAVVARVVRGIR
jgi:hypothetical protein